MHGHILLLCKRKTLSLIENDKSQITDKVFNEISLEDLRLSSLIVYLKKMNLLKFMNILWILTDIEKTAMI